MNPDPNPNPNPNNPNNLLDTIILLGYNVRMGWFYSDNAKYVSNATVLSLSSIR